MCCCQTSLSSNLEEVSPTVKLNGTDPRSAQPLTVAAKKTARPVVVPSTLPGSGPSSPVVSPPPPARRRLARAPASDDEETQDRASPALDDHSDSTPPPVLTAAVMSGKRTPVVPVPPAPSPAIKSAVDSKGKAAPGMLFILSFHRMIFLLLFIGMTKLLSIDSH